jgi:hypothetical protein
MYVHDEYPKGQATTDRGWMRFTSQEHHPQGNDPLYDWWFKSNEGSYLNCGFWLDYEHGKDYEPAGESPTILAVAYVFRFSLAGVSSDTIASTWCWNADEAKTWLEETIREHVGQPA